MKKFQISAMIFLVAALIAAGLWSCSESVSFKDSKMSLTEIVSQQSSSSKSGYLYSTSSNYMHSLTQVTTHQMHHAYFYDNSLKYYPADNVHLNGNEIRQMADNDNVVFDGSTPHIWVVTGNQHIPSYSDTIQSLNTFLFTGPSPMDTVYKNAGTTINYTTISGADSVAVYARFNRGLSSIIDTSYWYSSFRYKNVMVVPNTGTIYLPSSFFQSFTADTYMTIEVAAARHKSKVVNNKEYFTACVVSCRTDYYLK